MTRISRLSLGMVPFTPVTFSDPSQAWVAWTRLGVYGGVAALSWRRARTVSYIAMAAGAVCLLTSLSADAMKQSAAAVLPPAGPQAVPDSHGGNGKGSVLPLEVMP